MRTFKHVVKSEDDDDGNEDRHKSALDQDLDRPLHKEATL